MPDTDVRFEHVSKRFQEVLAVADLTLEIQRGEFFSLLGPSGCGKTTTLRMIAGFEDVTEGELYLGDRDVTALPPYKRDVNTVFQSYALFPHLSVLENVAFGLRRRKVRDGEVRQRVAEMLTLVELEGYERRRPSQLSGGQQQRVALARALINRPRVLLLDEPLGALDLKLRKQMQIELKRIQTEVGITFIYVTHDQDEAMTMSDRIGVMRRGRLLQLGRPQELYERPANEFVAGFLGVSNLLDGTVAGSEDSLTWIELEDGTRLRAPADGLPSAGAVRVGVRPEKVRLVAAGTTAEGELAPDDMNVLEGRIIDSSYVGVSTQYVVRVEGSHDLIVYTQNLETSGVAEQLAAGELVRLSWKPQHTFVIPAEASV